MLTDEAGTAQQGEAAPESTATEQSASTATQASASTPATEQPSTQQAPTAPESDAPPISRAEYEALKKERDRMAGTLGNFEQIRRENERLKAERQEQERQRLEWEAAQRTQELDAQIDDLERQANENGFEHPLIKTLKQQREQMRQQATISQLAKRHADAFVASLSQAVGLTDQELAELAASAQGDHEKFRAGWASKVKEKQMADVDGIIEKRLSEKTKALEEQVRALQRGQMRSPDTTPGSVPSGRRFTRADLATMSQDEFRKHENEIWSQLAARRV